jgi:hypothetical protein
MPAFGTFCPSMRGMANLSWRACDRKCRIQYSMSIKEITLGRHFIAIQCNSGISFARIRHGGGHKSAFSILQKCVHFLFKKVKYFLTLDQEIVVIKI